MRIAIVFNRDSRSVINLFGVPNREKIGMKTIRRLVHALKARGHRVVALEGDKDLIERLEDFMPRVMSRERPGLVFNVSYGIQGKARYTHVPSILEMVGIPYVASSPLGHGLALDKVVTKVLLTQNGLPTPDFAVLEGPDTPMPNLRFPVIVKPKNEAVSLGLRVCHDQNELREGAGAIFEEFGQPVLAEEFIEGRELNVGILGNYPPEAFQPVELDFGADGPTVYTYEDKVGRSGRSVRLICPARIGDALTAEAQELAVKAFHTLGLYDFARVDMRLDEKGKLSILEVNSLPSLGESSSYVMGAAAEGLEFEDLINRVVAVASARYFGASEPPKAPAKARTHVTDTFSYVTEHREQLEKRLKEWISVPSLSNDPIGLENAYERAARFMNEVGLKPVEELTDLPEAATWQTERGFDDGTLLIAQADVPRHPATPPPVLRRDPEWIYGDGAGARGALVVLECALRFLKSKRQLRKSRLGVLLYFDEGFDARNSARTIQVASRLSKRALVLQPGHGNDVIVQRRGYRRYRLLVETEPLRIGRSTRKPDALRWASTKLAQCAALTSRKDRLAVVTLDIKAEHRLMHAPHRVTATVVVTFAHDREADLVEAQMRDVLGKRGPNWHLQLVAHRPPMPERRSGIRLAKKLESIAADWDIPLKRASSAWPSVAGLAPAGTDCVCGLGPVTRDPRTPFEAVQRISLTWRTLLLSDFLAREATR